MTKPVHVDFASVTYRRVARKPHRCGCGRQIRIGDVHLEGVAFPNHDANGGTTPWRLRECAKCATRYGREIQLGEIPYDQLCRDGLL